MKRLLTLLLLAAVSLPVKLQAQVSVTATLGTTGPTNYTTLNLAFAAVNAGTHKGAISMSITADITESASASLSASGTGSSSYSGITITPSGARTVTGAFTTAPVIDLNGADNVTINGLNSGGNSLTISNVSAGSGANLSTVRMINGATSNLLTNCTLLGSFNGSVSTNPGGTVLIATASAGTGGNNNNTVSNNVIGPVGGNLPSKAVNGNGSSSAINTGNIISNNNIYDYFSAGQNNAGVYLNGSNASWTISGNRFYQTGSRQPTSGIQHSAIWAIGSNSGHTISNNIIGYASAAATGVYTFTGTSSSDFIPIYLQCGDGTSTISGNTIAGISATAGYTGTGTGSSLKMIFATTSASNADVVISGNTIGSASATGVVALATTSSSTMDVFGILTNAFKTATISGNIVGGISLTLPGNAGTKIIGISLTGSTGTYTCQNNSIGGSVAHSLTNTSNATSAQVLGITSNGGGTFSGNLVRNISGNGGAGTSSIITGLYFNGTSALTISQNTLFAISHRGTSGSGSIVSGIQVDAGSTVDITRNKIYDISSAAASTATSVAVNGIYVAGGTTVNVANNFIGDLRSTAASQADAIRGIALNTSAASTAVNVSFNTVYLSATSSGTNFGTSALFHRASATPATNTLTLRNNILVNLTTAKGTGLTVALRRSATNLENYATTSNNNLFYAGTPGAANLIYYDGTNSDQTLAAFKARVTTRETSSITGSPNFLSTTGSNSNFLRINTTEPTSIESGGTPIAGITTDYDADTRNGTTPDMGADEFAGTACAVSINESGPFCITSSPTLTSSSATVFNQWNVGGSPIGGATNTSYNVLAAGSYTVSLNAPTCQVTSAPVIVYSQSTAPGILNSSAPAAVCSGSNVILTQTGGTLGSGAHWQWYTDAAFTQPVGATTIAANAQITVAPTATTTYYLRAEGGTAPCASTVSGSASVVISIRAPLSASIVAPQPIQCQAGQSATLNITNGPANGSVTVTTNGANSQVIALDGSGAASFLSDPLPANATFTITSVSDGVCTTNTSISETVYVGVLIADPINNQSACPGQTVGPLTFQGNFPAGTTYSWTSTNPAIGLAPTSGSGTTLPSFTSTNSTNGIIYSDIAVVPNLNLPGCTVRRMVFRISVKPTPSVNATGSQTLCAGAQTIPVSFSGNDPANIYTWTNSNPAIGIAAQGAGDLPAFTATNNSNQTAIVGTFTVTPLNDGCTGASTSFTITVNKSTVSITYPNSPYCQSGTANPRRSGSGSGTFTAPAGVVFNSASSGEINLGASQPGTYIVTYTVSNAGIGCGGSTTASITILPRATVNIIPNQALCAGSSTTLVQPTGTASGFSWVNLNPAVGLAANGTGAIPAFVAVNNTAGTVTAQVNVTPLGDGFTRCNGNPIAYRYLIYPRPVVNPVVVPDYCRGVLTAPVTFSSATAGTSYTWSNNNTSIGLAASGRNGLPVFTAANPSAPGGGSTNTATITVTPSSNKCAGTPYQFSISVLDCIAQSGGTGSGDATLRSSQFVVGPNPATSRVVVELKGAEAGPYSAQLLTTYGLPVSRVFVISANTLSIDLSGLTPGTYVLHLVNQRTKQSVQKQVIKL